MAESQFFKNPYVKVSAGGLLSLGEFETSRGDILIFDTESATPDNDLASWTRDVGMGFFGAIAAGVQPTRRLRVEAEFNRASASANEMEVSVITDGREPFFVRDTDVSVSMTNFLINGWYDVAQFRKTRLYLGGGVGISRVKATSDPTNPPAEQPAEGLNIILPSEDSSKTTVALHAGAGVSYDVAKKWQLGGEVRYYKKTDVGVENSGFSVGGLAALATISFAFQGRDDTPPPPRREPVNTTLPTSQ